TPRMAGGGRRRAAAPPRPRGELVRHRVGGERMTVHVGLYGDVNLNIVDGSAIWLVSVAQLLEGIEDVRTTLLLKAPVERDVLSGTLEALSTVRVIEPGHVLRDQDEAAARL